jgi:hypothetical protein
MQHDSLVEDDGRLRMAESKRRSVSDVMSPTAKTPLEQTESAPHKEPRSVLGPDLPPAGPSLDPAPENKKAKKKYVGTYCIC